MHFVIIGGDAAGMSAASRARRHMPDLAITVYEKTMDVSYSACGMPYNIAEADRQMEDLVVRPAEVFKEKQGIRVLTGHEVKRIDAGKKEISGVAREGGPFTSGYDKLLIATGASALRPPLPGIDLPGVQVLKNMEDGRSIKSFLMMHPVKSAVIIGMGYIALEMCEALCARGVRVDMVKPRSALLPWMPPELSEMVRQALTENRVGVYDGHEIEGIVQEKDALRVVCRDLSLTADMVLVATGIRPNTRMAAEAGIRLGAGGAISVDRGMQTSVADIYAAGDCADALHVVTGKPVWIPLALRANRAGWAVADRIAGKERLLDGVAGTAVFKVFDLEVARSGLSLEEARAAGFSPESVVIESRSRAHAHPGASFIRVHMLGDRDSGRLLGAQMVGREGVAHRINAVAVALHNRMTVAGFSQTDLAYAPPFGPVWDPTLTAANQLMKKIG
jgi:NADPH-dependent 2,4-dienoyl-CoA reductase/sulfur reductase-like enzyme